MFFERGKAAFNPISVLARADLDQMTSDAAVSAIALRIMEEVKAVGTSLGAEIAVGVEERLRQARGLGALRSSMLQDFERGRPMETDALLGAVLDLARMTSTPTPTLQVVAGLIALLAKTRSS